jgi:hypothetical protein
MRWLTSFLVACGFLWSCAAWAQPAKAPGKREFIRTRIEFLMGSTVFGQTTQPGEVRILDRRETELKSMVKRRTGFQEEIIQTVFPDYTR